MSVRMGERSTVQTVLWPAIVSALVVELLADLAFHDPTLNVMAFAVVFVVVVSQRYHQHLRDRAFLERVAVGRERLIAEKIRHCQVLGLDEETTRRALGRCDFDRAAVCELVLSDACPE